MNARARKVLEEALELSPDERDELVRKLIPTLDAKAADEIEHAWADVIAQRAREVLDGTAPTRDLDEALEALEARARPSAR